MKAIFGDIRLSATDVRNHLACHHLTSLDLTVSLGSRPALAWYSPDARVLQEQGMAHEDAYLAHLEAQGASVLNLRDTDDSERAASERTSWCCEVYDSKLAPETKATTILQLPLYFPP